MQKWYSMKNLELDIEPEKIKKKTTKDYTYWKKHEKERYAKNSEEINDDYVKDRIIQSPSCGINRNEIPQEMIEEYRALVIFRRTLKKQKG